MPLPVIPARAPDRAFDVVGLGENSLDFLGVVSGRPAPGGKQDVQRFELLPGGQTSTAVVTCARLGWRSRYIGSFGVDAFGAQMEKALQREDVDVVAIRHPDARNRIAFVLVDAQSGERTVFGYRDARLAIAADELNVSDVTSGRVLMVDATDVPAATAAARAARAAGIPTVVDVERPMSGVDRLLREIDILIAAEPFPQAMTGAASTGEGLRRLAEDLRSALVIATLGSRGSLACYEGREIHTPAFQTDVVDTTGAGDAFRGGFVAAWLDAPGPAPSVEPLLIQANRVAAINCRAFGAQTALPTRTEIDRFL